VVKTFYLSISNDKNDVIIDIRDVAVRAGKLCLTWKSQIS
jgi:hypothetical protein